MTAAAPTTPTESAAGSAAESAAGRSADRRANAAERVLAHLAGHLDAKVSVRLWDGRVVPLGADVVPELQVEIASPGTVSSLMRRPTIENLMRHFAVGNIACRGGDLIAFGEALRVEGSTKKMKGLDRGLVLKNALPFLFAPADKPEASHAYDGEITGRVAAKRDNKDYISFHYDLSNDFYKLFLDPWMQYSCGYFTDPGNTVEQAQADKLEMICRKLRLGEDERMLDVGCGWGGLLCYAAKNYGVRGHGVTLSEEQLAVARERVAEHGLEDRVTLELRDYSTLEGEYDKISSIGMYEHVGIANYPTYFGKLRSLLRDKGILLNHGITRRAKRKPGRFKKMRPEHKLIARYIFPGAELDHVGHTVETLEAKRFEVHDVENWREHYAMTLRQWCTRLMAREEEAVGMIGRERYNLWCVYLAGCAFAFESGSLRIFQVVASKQESKGISGVPQTRADLYRRAA